MNPGLPAVDGRRAIRALQRVGFVIDRIAGSHHLLVQQNDPMRRVTVPVHGGKDSRPARFGALSDRLV
jgi:predicted RNA binding protein YcfA (HicA-like mRNA interferase family)